MKQVFLSLLTILLIPISITSKGLSTETREDSDIANGSLENKIEPITEVTAKKADHKKYLNKDGSYNPSDLNNYEKIYSRSGQQWHSHNLSVSNISSKYRPFDYPQYKSDSYEEETLLLLENTKPEVFFEVLSTRVGFDLEVTTEDAYKHYREYLNTNKKTIISETEETINGITWTIFKARGRFNGKSVLDYHYTSYVNGIAYTTLIWSYKNKNSFVSLKTEADKLIKSVSLADSNFYAYSEAVRKLTDRNSKDYGITLDLNGQNFIVSNAPTEEEGTFCSSFVNNIFFSLTPIYLGEQRYSLNEIVRGYEILLETSYTNSSNIKRKPVAGSKGKAVDYVYDILNEEGKVNGKAIIRFIQSKSTAVCIQYIDYSETFETPYANDSHFSKLIQNLKIDPIAQEPIILEKRIRDHANFYNGIGLYNAERNNINKALDFFKKAYELAPESVTITTNLVQTLALHGSYEASLELANATLTDHPENLNLLQYKGISSFNLNAPEDGIAAYRKIFFELDIRNANLLNEYLGYLFNDRSYDLMLENIEELQEYDSDPLTLTYWKAAALRDSGQLALARDASQELYEMEPENINLAGLHVDILLKDQDNAEALRICEEVIDMTGNLQMKYYTGLCYLSQQQYAPAREALQECLDAMPGHVGARELINHIHGLMGGTDPSLFSRSIEAVALDQTLMEIEATYPTDKLERKGVYGEYAGEAYFYEKNKPQKHTRYRKFKILDEKGAQEFKEMTEPFNPSYERIYVNEANVYDESGELVASGNKNQFYITNYGDDSIINEEKNLHITFPSVSVGHTISLVVTHETNAAVEKFQFQNPILSGMYPRKYTFAQVTGDIEDIVWAQNLDTINFQKNEKSLTWYSIYPASYENVMFVPDASSFVPMVWLASKEDESWKETADIYYSDIKDFVDNIDPTSKEIAKTLTHDKSIDSKINAVMEYISSNYSYKAILFGPKARIPRTFTEIEANKFGDCKDHTILAIHLLRELGVKTYPALVNTFRTANSDLISLDQFNHMILYVPESKTNKFIDPTDHFLGKSYRPQYLEGQPALVVRKENSFMDTIGHYRDIDNQMRIDRKISIEDNDQTMITESVTAYGLSASYIRQMLFNVPINEQTKVLQSYLKQAEPSIAIKKLNLENLDARHEPLNLSYDYSVSRNFTSNGQTLQGRCPTTWDNLYYYHNKTDAERTIPFKISTPFSLELNLSIKTPENYTLNSNSLLSELNEADQFGSQIIDLNNQSTNTINLHYNFSLNTGTFAANDYPRYIEHAEKAINRLSLPISYKIK